MLIGLLQVHYLSPNSTGFRVNINMNNIKYYIAKFISVSMKYERGYMDSLLHRSPY